MAIYVLLWIASAINRLTKTSLHPSLREFMETPCCMELRGIVPFLSLRDLILDEVKSFRALHSNSFILANPLNQSRWLLLDSAESLESFIDSVKSAIRFCKNAWNRP